MTSPTHVVISLAAALGLARVNNIPFTALNLLCVLVGSLFPDIDADGGAITRPGKILSRFLPKGIGVIIDGIVTAISKLINKTIGHRGPLHWPIIPIILYISGVVLGKAWLMWFAWGYLWHILADFCTSGGIPIWGPFSTKFIRWSNLKTGSKPETLVFLLALCVVFYLGWGYLPEITRYWLLKYYSLLNFD